jgi:hypothetical protein
VLTPQVAGVAAESNTGAFTLIAAKVDAFLAAPPSKEMRCRS